jgi:hypothetical protein
MKSLLIPLLILCSGIAFGQYSSNEDFVSKVSHLVLDSSFSKFYLSAEAAPGRFTRFDYGQLINYSLKEAVSIDILNELSRHVYEDTADLRWTPGNIPNAICIGADQIRSVLNPGWGLKYDRSLTDKQKEKSIKQFMKQWDKKPQEEKLVFFFSRPEFTNDHQYAVIDLDFRCDEHECGRLATYLFRKVADGWKTIGIISAAEGSGA